MLTALYDWLDAQFFPGFRTVVTNRLFIVGLLILGIVLMIDDNSLLQLKGGNFTNVTSAVLGCVVLLQQLRHHAEATKVRAQQTEAIAALHAKLDAHGAAVAALAQQTADKDDAVAAHLVTIHNTLTTITPAPPKPARAPRARARAPEPAVDPVTASAVTP